MIWVGKLELDARQVGDRIEAVRRAYGLEKRDMAKAIGIDPSTYSKVIAGRMLLRAPNAAQLSRKFRVTLDFLYLGDTNFAPTEVKAEVEAAKEGQTK